MQQSLPDTTPADVDADEELLKLKVSLSNGSRYEPPAAPGYRLMELMRMFGLPIKAECGGAGICATCHVRIPESWQHLLPPPSDEELAKLDEIPDADEHSRLACQLIMTEEMDGLEVEVQADSLVPQTFWAAG